MSARDAVGESELFRQHAEAMCDVWWIGFSAWVANHLHDPVNALRAAYMDGLRDATDPLTLAQIECERSAATALHRNRHAIHRSRPDTVCPARRASDAEALDADIEAEIQRARAAERDRRRAGRPDADQPPTPEVTP